MPVLGFGGGVLMLVMSSHIEVETHKDRGKLVRSARRWTRVCSRNTRVWIRIGSRDYGIILGFGESTNTSGWDGKIIPVEELLRD